MLDRRLNRREFVRSGGVALALPLLTGISTTQSNPLSAAREQARRLVDEGVPSLSVAVIHRGRPMWVEAFGWADRARRMPARTTTPYAIASATKPFTGLAVAQLVAADKIGLDAPLENYLNGISIETYGRAQVTVRQALQHRSGIPRHWRNLFLGQGQPPPFASVARDHAFSTAAQDKRYLYANTNYGLLAAAVEAVTKQQFHDHLRETVLRPLALTTAAPLRAHFGNWRAAVPYEEDGAQIPPYLVDEEGARDLVMSAFDLACFGLAHLDGRLGEAGVLMLDERAALPANGVARASYGLGWIVEEEGPAALFSYGHTGEGPGAASSLTVVPGEELVVATIANQQGPAAYVLNEMIVDAMSPQFAASRKAHPFQEVTADEGALQALAGRWVGELQTPAGAHPVAMTLEGAGSRIELREQTSALTHVRVHNGVLTARADLDVPAPDAQRWPHQARISLEPSGGDLDGTLAAYASRGKIAHDQFWLSYRLRLRRN